MADLRHAAINEWEAVYLINVKIIPTIKYPLQVAVVPRSVLKAWDDTHVALIRRKGVIDMDMPKDIMFMPEEKGGYGLTSMVDLVDRMRVEMYMQALNDYTIREDGDEILSTQAHITRLTEGHRERRGTLGYSTSSSEERLGVSVRCNPTSIKTAAQRDLAAALKRPRLRGGHGTLNIYTDGGTIPGIKPRTAWGLEI